MRVLSIVIRSVATLALASSLMGGAAMADEPIRLPVPATVIYPGDVIKDELIIERAFAPNMQGVAAFIGDRASAVGRTARRMLAPGQPMPINALEDRKVISRGSMVKVVVEDGMLTIVTYASSLQAGGPGALIQLRNVDTGVIIRGVVQEDGSVRIQNG